MLIFLMFTVKPPLIIARHLNPSVGEKQAIQRVTGEPLEKKTQVLQPSEKMMVATTRAWPCHGGLVPRDAQTPAPRCLCVPQGKGLGYAQMPAQGAVSVHMGAAL